MGLECGFDFYKMVEGKLVPINVEDRVEDRSFENSLFICGRCEATYTFCNPIVAKEDRNSDYCPFLLMNHPELDGYEHHRKDTGSVPQEYVDKFFYYGLDEFKSLFDFEVAQRKHDEAIKEIKTYVKQYRKDIESLRKHQEAAQTKVAFDGFEEKIKERQEDLQCALDELKDTVEDDYVYNHYMWIKEDIEIVEKIIKEDPDIIVAAFASY